MCAAADAARQQVCTCKKVINIPKNTPMSHPPHLFGSALASRAFYHFIVKQTNTQIHTISSTKVQT